MSVLVRHRLMKRVTRLGSVLALVLIGATVTAADTVDVSVPNGVTFFVADINVATTGSPDPATVSYTNASLTAGDSLRISVIADTQDFAVPVAGTAIPSNRVTWITIGAVGGTGYSGTLSDVGYGTVFESNADPTSGHVDVKWTLAALPSGVRAGNHTLTVRWKFEAF